MNKRGKILREPRTGPGLLMIEGRQYWFALDRMWRSDVPAKPGLAVDVKLDRAGQVLAITAASESLVEQQGGGPEDTVRTAGAAIFRKIASMFGLPNLSRR